MRIGSNTIQRYINFFYLRIDGSFIKKPKNIIIRMIGQMKQTFTSMIVLKIELLC
jgi:hypothetical protein